MEVGAADVYDEDNQDQKTGFDCRLDKHLRFNSVTTLLLLTRESPAIKMFIYYWL